MVLLFLFLVGKCWKQDLDMQIYTPTRCDCYAWLIQANLLNLPPRIFPQSFDEIYSLREQLASFKVSIGREQADQEAYYAFIKTLDNPEQVILDKYLDGGRGDARYAIVPNEHPAALPEGVSHLLMWYIDENAPYSWVANKISEYFVDQRLTTQDFVVYRKPSNSGLFTPGFSRSITLPHVQILVRAKVGP